MRVGALEALQPQLGEPRARDDRAVVELRERALELLGADVAAAGDGALKEAGA